MLRMDISSPARVLFITRGRLRVSVATQPDKEPERTIMGRKSHFIELRVDSGSQQRPPLPVFRQSKSGLQDGTGFACRPMHPFDSFAAYRDNRLPGLRCRAPEVDPDQAIRTIRVTPERFAGRLKTLSGDQTAALHTTDNIAKSGIECILLFVREVRDYDF